MTPIPPEHVEAVARAWDAEEAAMCGEPSPWDLGREDEGFELWANERRALAQAALTTALALGYRHVGEGEVVVPREPSLSRLKAGADAAQGASANQPFSWLNAVREAWTAMITAHQKEGGE